jgi:RNA polymerase sigma-70 factor (ECF subfamily)
MKYFDNLSYEEMSEITETSIGSLKASYHLAVKKIKKFIDLN